MYRPFYDIRKWLGAPWNTEWKNSFPLGVCPCKPVWLAFPSVGDVTSALEMEDQCLGVKVGFGRVEASCRGCALGILRSPFLSMERWWGSKGASGFGLLWVQSSAFLPPQGEAQSLPFSLLPSDKDSPYSFSPAPGCHTLPQDQDWRKEG